MNASDASAAVRRARRQCYLAAAVFGGCAVLLLVLPLPVALPVRVVGAAFNVILALAVALYGKQLRGGDVGSGEGGAGGPG